MKKGEDKKVYLLYNKIGDWFAENRSQTLTEKKYLDKIISLIPENAQLLDIGCGTGYPILNYFQEKGFKITGVDASEKMLTLARKNFPSTEFIFADMRKLLLSEKFDAIIAWHSFFHLPANDQRDMFAIFQTHLNPAGILTFTSGNTYGEAWGMNGGENLFHASLDSGEYRMLLEKHHFNILEHVIDDPECGNATIWMAQYNPL